MVNFASNRGRNQVPLSIGVPNDVEYIQKGYDSILHLQAAACVLVL